MPPPHVATMPRDWWAPAGFAGETGPQPLADRSWTSSAEPRSAARPAERTGTRRQGAAEGALAWPQHAPIHVTPVVVFCGILWPRSHKPVRARLSPLGLGFLAFRALGQFGVTAIQGGRYAP